MFLCYYYCMSAYIVTSVNQVTMLLSAKCSRGMPSSASFVSWHDSTMWFIVLVWAPGHLSDAVIRMWWCKVYVVLGALSSSNCCMNYATVMKLHILWVRFVWIAFYIIDQLLLKSVYNVCVCIPSLCLAVCCSAQVANEGIRNGHHCSCFLQIIMPAFLHKITNI